MSHNEGPMAIVILLLSLVLAVYLLAAVWWPEKF
jgi:K+-transporting ATPase KdpF subunit